MNPETERRLAAMIMEEANMMRQRAEREGVSAYLAKPVVKARPNRQFLTAMVRGVQHANRMVDMEEMWRQRELENKASRDKRSRRWHHEEEASKAERDEYGERRNSNGEAQISDGDDDGLNDEDIDKFLHSKVKRGRGAVGSRMDEPGPYRAHTDAEIRRKEDWEARIATTTTTTRPVAGPSLPPPESRKKQKKLDVSDSDDDDDEVARKRLRRERKKEKRNSEKHESKKKKKRRR